MFLAQLPKARELYANSMEQEEPNAELLEELVEAEAAGCDGGLAADVYTACDEEDPFGYAWAGLDDPEGSCHQGLHDV